MVVKIKEYFKKPEMLKRMTVLKNIIYVVKEIQDIMKKFYLERRNLTISILFLIQHNCIISRLSSVDIFMNDGVVKQGEALRAEQ